MKVFTNSSVIARILGSLSEIGAILVYFAQPVRYNTRVHTPGTCKEGCVNHVANHMKASREKQSETMAERERLSSDNSSSSCSDSSGDTTSKYAEQE